MSRLFVADGHPCPWCGCRDSEVIREPLPPLPCGDQNQTMWPQPGSAKCGHCRRVFRVEYAPPKKPAELRPVRYFAGPDCPECGSADTKVHTTKKASGRRVRYHKCAACDHNFKTSEESEPEEARIA